MILGSATVTDIKTGRVKNRLILTGYSWGLLFKVLGGGLQGIQEFFIDAAWPIVILYLLFLVRGLGAGDIKVFSVISPFLDTKIMVSTIILSFFIGAGISCLRIVTSFVRKQSLQPPGKVELDLRKKALGEGQRETIRFCPCILLGYLIAVIGEIRF